MPHRRRRGIGLDWCLIEDFADISGMKITHLKLQHFKGFESAYFEFGNNPINLFFGPNGIGKSSILEAVQLVANPRIFDGRTKDDVAFYLHSLIQDNDYSPLAARVLTKGMNWLRLEGHFDGGVARSVLTNEGFVERIPDAHGGHAFYVDADNSSNLAKFQLTDVEAPKFVELAEAIYGYECDLDGEVLDERTGEDGVTVKHLFYNDFILYKGPAKVHFAQMSDGEKKIATLLRQICNPDNTAGRDIILIDNIEMHVYYKRHRVMLEKLLEMFAGKQIVATTHSPEMINCVDPSWRFDLEKYRPEYAMGHVSHTSALQAAFNNVVSKLEEDEGWGGLKIGSTPKRGNYPDWVHSCYDVSCFNSLQSEAILIDLDTDEVFDPIQVEYEPGMLRPPGKREPPPRPLDPRWVYDTAPAPLPNIDTEVADLTQAPARRRRRVFKPVSDIKKDKN
jgi:predicted ATPase